MTPREQELSEKLFGGLSWDKIKSDLGKELTHQVAAGAHELAAALFNGQAFVMYRAMAKRTRCSRKRRTARRCSRNRPACTRNAAAAAYERCADAKRHSNARRGQPLLRTDHPVHVRPQGDANDIHHPDVLDLWDAAYWRSCFSCPCPKASCDSSFWKSLAG